MNRQGEIVIEPQWNYAGLFRQGVAIVGMGEQIPEVIEDYSDWGLLRSDGTMILPVEYMIDELTSGFRYCAWDEDADCYGKEGFYDLESGAQILERDATEEEAKAHPHGWGQLYGLGKPDGTVIVEPIYDYIDYAGGGLYSIYLDGLCGVMDADGRVIVPPTYDISTGGPPPGIYFSGAGYAVVDDSKEHRHILMDREGRELYSVPYSTEDETGATRFNNILPPAENGCFWVYSYTVSKPGNYRQEDVQYTLMRVFGDRVDMLTEQMFDDVFADVEDANCGQQDDDFAEGVQAVSRDGKWGYIDENGLTVLDFQWDAASIFRDGLALVEKDGKLSYIDRSGAAVWLEK